MTKPIENQAEETPTTVSIAVQIAPFLTRTGVDFRGDVQALAEQVTHYVAANLSKRFTEQHEAAGLFVAVAVKRGEESGGHQYREGHFVRSQDESVHSPVVPGSHVGGGEQRG